MRILISTSDRSVQVITTARERVPLESAEAAALRLFSALPGPKPDPEKNPVGFAVDSDTERAHPEPARDDAEEQP